MPEGNRNTLRDAPLDPTLTDVLNLLKRAVQADVRTHIPARVITYNATTQEASVSVESLTVVPNKLNPADRNAETILPPIRIDGVQVAFERSPTGYVTVPITPGTTGYLVIFDRSIDTWRQYGVAADPGLDHMHNLSDCVFEPRLWPKTAPIVPATDLTATVIEGPLVKLGRGAIDFVALAALVLTRLNAIHAHSLTHMHPTAATGPPSPAAPTIPPLAPVAAPVAATKGMAK